MSNTWNQSNRGRNGQRHPDHPQQFGRHGQDEERGRDRERNNEAPWRSTSSRPQRPDSAFGGGSSEDPRNAADRFDREDFEPSYGYDGRDQTSRTARRYEEEREYEGSRGPSYDPNDSRGANRSMDNGWPGRGLGLGQGGDTFQARGEHFGKGPRNYRKSDDRILDEVNEALTRHGELDASDIEVEVKDGEVILTGSVTNRSAKRTAEDAASEIYGVNDVTNQLKIKGDRFPSGASRNTTPMESKKTDNGGQTSTH